MLVKELDWLVFIDPYGQCGPVIGSGRCWATNSAPKKKRLLKELKRERELAERKEEICHTASLAETW